MKVLHILNELKFSGAEVMYVASASDFIELGCELQVVNTASNFGEYASYFEKVGYKTLHWPYEANSLRYINEVVNYLQQEKIDVVHIHRANLRWVFAFCAWKAGCKSIYTFHNVFPSNWYSRWYHILQRWSAKKMLKCTFQTISDSVYRREKEFYLNNTKLIYNWYDNNRFAPPSEGEQSTARRKLQIPQGSLVFITVGGCSHIKRHSEVLKALPIILDKYPDAVYLHLGDGEDLQSEMELAKSLGIQERVRFIGNQSNLRQYYIASDLYIMTSKFEGIPLTTIEALACAIPAILYDVPGLKDFNKEIECAAIIEENYKTLAEEVINLFEDKARQNLLSTNGLTLVNNKFNMSKNTRQIFSLYVN